MDTSFASYLWTELFPSQSHSPGKGEWHYPELRSLGEGLLGTWIPAVPGGWMPGTEHCTHRILLISTSVISPPQGSGLPVPEHLLPLSRHPPLCYLSNIQSFFQRKICHLLLLFVYCSTFYSQVPACCRKCRGYVAIAHGQFLLWSISGTTNHF